MHRVDTLHAWDWSHVDTRDWRDAFVPRPKTRKSGTAGARLKLPEPLVPALQAWWDAQDRPESGPVFPVRRGPRAGQRKGKDTYARKLRAALWAAGVVRPLPGFHEAEGEDERKGLCQIQSGSDDLLPLDFHSFRRAFSTGLAGAGVNVQTAMLLAGHRSAQTHSRYIDKARTLATPSAALPTLPEGFGVEFRRRAAARPDQARSRRSQWPETSGKGAREETAFGLRSRKSESTNPPRRAIL